MRNNAAKSQDSDSAPTLQSPIQPVFHYKYDLSSTIPSVYPWTAHQQSHERYHHPVQLPAVPALMTGADESYGNKHSHDRSSNVDNINVGRVLHVALSGGEVSRKLYCRSSWKMGFNGRFDFWTYGNSDLSERHGFPNVRHMLD